MREKVSQSSGGTFLLLKEREIAEEPLVML